jgi:L-fuculose-phosphate aldolase
MMQYQQAREQVYETVMKAVTNGLIRLSAGNISARTADGLVAITPASIAYDVLKPEDIAIIDLAGKPVDAPRKPSSETPMHTAIYRGLPHVGAVLHTHSPFAITFATLGKEVPVISIELFTCGAPIPVAPWACPGTDEAGVVTVDMFCQRPRLKVCLLRNHGLVAIGKDLASAFEVAYDAEIGMQVYHQALQLGQPELITQPRIEQMLQVYA